MKAATVPRAESPRAAGETRAICAAESVNRLLEIAHEKKLAPGHFVVAQRHDQFHLQGIGVLELIHQKQMQMGGPLFAQQVAMWPDQQPFGMDQKVVEIEHAKVLFFVVVGLARRRRPGRAIAVRFRPRAGRFQDRRLFYLETVDSLAEEADRLAITFHIVLRLSNLFSCPLPSAWLHREARSNSPEMSVLSANCGRFSSKNTNRSFITGWTQGFWPAISSTVFASGRIRHRPQHAGQAYADENNLPISP